MGSTISRVSNGLFGNKKVNIMMIGVDGSGKTTILYRLKTGETPKTFATIGQNVETIEYKNISLTISDVATHPVSRRWMWEKYYNGGANVDAIIFVVDASDKQRVYEARDDFLCLMTEVSYSKEPIVLVLANKQDLPNTVSTAEIPDKLGLNSMQRLKAKRWHIQETCAIQGKGLYEGLDWLIRELAK